MTDWGPDDAELVLAAAGGDDVAVSRLVDRWLPVALRWCNRLCGPKVDPEDAAHDSIMIVLRRLPDLLKPDAFPSWLYGIVRRTIAGHRRPAWGRRCGYILTQYQSRCVKIPCLINQRCA